MKNGEGRARAMLTVVVLATAEAVRQRWSWRADSDGRLRTGRRCCRDERGEAVGRAVSARALSGRRRRGRGELSGERRARGRCRGVGGAVEASYRDARRAVPTAALSCCVGAVRGGHAATACCRTGPARRAASDRWGPLVSDF
jgi:hypothetical protein